VPFEKNVGGGAFPWTAGVAMQEILASANVAFSLCPMLTQGAVELLARWGSPSQQRRFLPPLVTGEWTGTMNLTEPDAGSDVGAVRTMAVPRPDGTWSITGTKIFITWGDHDLTDNIVHLVLARTPDAPPGTKGISLFLVPAVIDGDRNRVRCLSLEHKLGIVACPTAVLDYDGAVGELVGELHGGMPAMFTMMNRARLSVGVEGLGLSERAYQTALAYARERRQGRRPGSTEPARIIEHPDVRRMLLSMRADLDAMRLLIYATAAAIDSSVSHPTAEERRRAGALASLLVPLAKAWPTDAVNTVTSTAIQVHGGAGYIEETGVAQLARDARISSIYEGTNGIQAIDLVMRKVSLGNGDPLPALLADMTAAAERLAALDGGADLSRPLAAARTDLAAASEWIVERRAQQADDVLAVATPFLEVLARSVAGTLLAQEVLEPSTPGREAAARFFLGQQLANRPDLGAAIVGGTAAIDWLVPEPVSAS
jgi:alkylation response protein AidB-like acyl-CoA dehydrogenase